MDISQVGRAFPYGQCQRVAWVSGCHYPCAFQPRLLVAGLLMLFLDPPQVGTVGIPAVESVEPIKLSSLQLSGQLSPALPQTVAWGDLGDSSVPMSPNRVQAGHSQYVPD